MNNDTPKRPVQKNFQNCQGKYRTVQKRINDLRKAAIRFVQEAREAQSQQEMEVASLQMMLAIDRSRGRQIIDLTNCNDADSNGDNAEP